MSLSDGLSINLLNVELSFVLVERIRSRQKMAWRSETEVKEELVIKEEFYEISMGGVNYKNIPEKYRTITASPLPSSPLLRCRLCALPNYDMVDIFTVQKTEESIIDKIEACLRIVVRSNLNDLSVWKTKFIHSFSFFGE